LGYRGARYGSMGEQVLGLEVVLPGGEVLNTRALPRSSTGLRLRHLFIGGEGVFGVITAATLQVFARPEAQVLHLFHFRDYASGFNAVCEMARLGMRPTLLDYGGSGLEDPGTLLYLGFEGFQEEIAALDSRALDICARHGGERRPDADAQEF